MIQGILKRWLYATFIFLSIISSLEANNNLILCNDNNIIKNKAIDEIKKIGSEVKEKTGIAIYLCVKESINNQKIKAFEKKLALKLKNPYILLTLAKDEQKVDIITSPKTAKMVDTDEILSPFSGTIIPILTSRKGVDKYSAAILNGYADIADKIADKLGIKLQNSLGNTNRILINILRIIVYGSFLYFIIMYIRKKLIYKKRKQ